MSAPTIQAIETVYKGYRFRSRLEARWAVFFDALGMAWDYEPEGFDLGGTRYLPDFWLKTISMWGEVKPAPFTPDEDRKARLLADASGHAVLKLVGVPTFRVYWAVEPLQMDWPRELDYLLDDQYLHSEHRLFGSPGCRDDADASLDYDQSEQTRAAYEAARSARFEHGEAGAPGRRALPRAPRAGSVAGPQPAWHEIRSRALWEWLNAPQALQRKMESRWGAGVAIARTEAEAREILADLVRFAAELGA